MILNVMADGQTFPVNVPDEMLSGASEVFAKMDADLDQGKQMGRDWVDSPSVEQRCQFVADKLLTAIETENTNMALMMAAYILNKSPGFSTVVVDTQGEMCETHFM